MRRIVAVVLVVLIALPALADAAKRRGSTRYESSARLQASGSGRLDLSGRLVAFGQIPGRGRLIVRDARGNAVLWVDGEQIALTRRRSLRLWTEDSRFYVTGTSVRVRVLGAQVSLSAAGKGSVRLRGVGVYRLNGGEELDWPRAAFPLAPPPASSQKRRRRNVATRDLGERAGAGRVARGGVGGRS